jgi:hypothetical protein
MQLRRTLPLDPPRPFRVTSCEATTRAHLVEALCLVHRAIDEPRREVASAIHGALWSQIESTESDSRDLSRPLQTALGVGAALAASEPKGRSPRHKIARSTWGALGWAAVDLAASTTLRCAPWVDYGVRVGYYVARESTAGLAKVQSELEKWAQEQLHGTSYAASLDGYLVGEFVVSNDRRVGGRKYLPLRPSGSEREYDELVYDLAWDDLLESLAAPRLRGTPAQPKLVNFDWRPALPSHARTRAAEPTVAAAVLSSADLSMAAASAAARVEPRSPARGTPVVSPLPAAAIVNPVISAPAAAFVVAAAPISAAPVAPAPVTATAPVAPVPVAVAVVAPAVVAPAVLAPAAEAPVAARTAPKAGWYADSAGRHLLRWWDGATWTRWVSDGGAPFDERTPPAEVAAATPARRVDTPVRPATESDDRVVVDLRLDDLGIEIRTKPVAASR